MCPLSFYAPVTLQAEYPAVRGFTRQQNCLPGPLIYSEIWNFHTTDTWPLIGHGL